MAEYVSTNNPYKRKPNGKMQSIHKHRLVWMEAHGEIPKGCIIHHINGDKKDNRIENLECVNTMEHRYKHEGIIILPPDIPDK